MAQDSCTSKRKRLIVYLNYCRMPYSSPEIFEMKTDSRSSEQINKRAQSEIS